MDYLMCEFPLVAVSVYLWLTLGTPLGSEGAEYLVIIMMSCWQTRQSSGLQQDQPQQGGASSNDSSTSSRASAAPVAKRNGVPESHKHVSKSQMKGEVQILYSNQQEYN